MAVTTRALRRHHDFSRVFIALAVVAGLVAIAPIGAAVLGYGSRAVTPKTAFATAPSGEYAILGRNTGSLDVISVASADSGAEPSEVARVPHLEGFTSSGAVSPDGRQVALVSVDGGSPSRPVASLNVVNLESGKVVRAADNVTPNQTPAWSADSRLVAFSRSPAGNDSASTVTLAIVSASGKDERTLQTFPSALGVYPVGFSPAGGLIFVVIDGQGSTAWRDGAELKRLSANITRDWHLSPDGSSIAFIDVDTAAGVHYFARTVLLDSSAQAASVEELQAPQSALGVAWNPSTNAATFGLEPGSAAAGVEAQSFSAAGAPASGFDVPLGYSRSGAALVVNHWTGSSFDRAGTPALQLVTPSGRSTLDDFDRFYGWSAR